MHRLICTDLYAPEYDGGLLWNDPDVGIEWPLDGIDEIILSEKDKKQKTLKELFPPINPAPPVTNIFFCIILFSLILKIRYA